MTAHDRLIAWATGTLTAFAVAAFTLLYIILPCVHRIAAAFAAVPGAPGSH